MPLPWITSLRFGAAGQKRTQIAGRRRVWIERGRGAMDRLFGAMIGLVAPPRCADCGADDHPWGGVESVRPHLCEACQAEAVPPEHNRCGRCGAPVGPFLDTTCGCIHCQRDRFHFERVIRLGIYQSPLGRMCRTAKEPNTEELAAALADFLWQRESQALTEIGAQLVIPVPHHWRDNLRRSTQAPETIAAVLSRRLRVNLATHILAKVRRTEKQFLLPPSRRRTNLKGAFHVPRRFHSDVKGRRLLLVDDVLTTGATADEAARALLAAGASAVFVAVIARGLGKAPVAARPG